MGLSLEKIKRDFAKHRAKTAVLGVLSLVMVGFMVKAAIELRPRQASAHAPAALTAAANGSGGDEALDVPTDADEKIRQSRELWKVLREKRGMDAETAFTFDPAYFPVDMSKHVAEAEHAPVDRTPQPVVSTEAMERQARLKAIQEQARQLVVRSTVVGSGNSTRPVAVVNDRIMTIGDYISGFEITAIRAREVEFKKDGTTLAVKMADDTHVQ